MSEVRHILHEAQPSARVARAHVRDERGASIVIALVFFLICAIIGSVVLTAASVNAKAVQTNRDLQQTEFTVGSAAQLVGSQFSAVVLNVDYSGDSPSVVVDEDRTDTGNASFAIAFWEENGDKAWAAWSSGTPYTVDITVEPDRGGAAVDDVAGTLTIDADLNVKIDLALADAANAAYQESVLVQCIPTFDQAGQLTSFSYEAPVITKRDRGGA